MRSSGSRQQTAVPRRRAARALPSISADGRYVVFQSGATNLVTGRRQRSGRHFSQGMVTGVTPAVSTNGSNAEATGGSSVDARISADGRFVIFQSAATNLVVNDTNGLSDIFRKDLLTGTIVRVNTDSSGAQATGGASSLARIFRRRALRRLCQ